MDNEQIPCINAAILIYFSKEMPVSNLKQRLPDDTKFRVLQNEIEATIVEAKDCYAWEVDLVLTRLFSPCDLDQLSQVAEEFKGQIHIDLWYYSGETNPVIIFEGENMAIIHRLKANISIDGY